MKRTPVLFLLCALLIGACKKKDDVLCICHGNGQTNSYDFGIKDNPSLPSYAALCDTFGAHNNVDSCNLLVSGK